MTVHCIQDDGVSDSEEEQEKLTEYESVLKANDPNFGDDSEQEIAHDSPEWYQLHLATERIRVPEILFQVTTWPSGHRIRLRNRESYARIPLGCFRLQCCNL
jgi:hypothetical protein